MKALLPCAIYTRKSSEEGLEQDFNSLDAQREACEAFVLSQKEQGWKSLPGSYDDGGFSGGNTDRPGLQRLMADVTAGKVKIIVVYKVDRLTRSLADFAKLVEQFDRMGVSFVSVTQQFNTTSSMGRLTLNVLLSFAQFEREVTGERIRDKIAASKRKGMWMGGNTPIGYRAHERTLIIDDTQAERIRGIYRLYLEHGCVRKLKNELDQRRWMSASGKPFTRGHLYRILSNPVYIGKIAHKNEVYDGQHLAIIDNLMWQAVQEQLQGNRQASRTRTNAAKPSPLAGLLFDDRGKRLRPTHSQKGTRRYRYYVGEELHEAGRETHPQALRWPATELEDAVLNALQGFLKDESQLLKHSNQGNAGEIRRKLRHAADLAERLHVRTALDLIDVLNRIVKQICIHTDRIEIVVRMAAVLDDAELGAETIALVDVPVKLKRYGIAMRLIVNVPGSEMAGEPDPKMVALLAKAYRWFEQLRSGKVDGVQSIAAEEHVTASYVTWVVYLAFLAPDLVERIMKGDHPRELNAKRLLRMLPLPMSWEDQRARLGMSP